MEVHAAIIGAILGGFLAGISGVAVYLFQKNWDKRKLKELFISAIVDDLRNSISLYGKIKNTGKTQKFIPFESTMGLKKSRQIYEKNSEYLLLVKPYLLRKRIFDYYLESGALINLLEIYQNRVYAIQDQYNATLRRLKEKYPDLNDKQISDKTLHLNKDEAQEFIWLKDLTLDQLNNLDTIKIEAQLILDKLSKD